MGGTYVRHGDYRIPCLTLPEEERRFIGVWGQRHLRYLKEYRRSVYLNLRISGGLNDYLAKVDEQAQERFERIVEQMKQAQRITESLVMQNWHPDICRKQINLADILKKFKYAEKNFWRCLVMFWILQELKIIRSKWNILFRMFMSVLKIVSLCSNNRQKVKVRHFL